MANAKIGDVRHGRHVSVTVLCGEEHRAIVLLALRKVIDAAQEATTLRQGGRVKVMIAGPYARKKKTGKRYKLGEVADLLHGTVGVAKFHIWEPMGQGPQLWCNL